MEQKTISNETTIPCIVDGMKPIPILAIWESSTGWIWVATSKPYPNDEPDCYYGYVVGLADEWGTWRVKHISQIFPGFRRVPKTAWKKYDFVVFADADKLINGV